MGSDENISASLVDLAAFAGWTFSRCTAYRRMVWANVLSGLDILAPSFSTGSFDEDGFQQELIWPATSSARLSTRTRVARRPSLSDSSINALVEAGGLLVPMTRRWSVVDRPLKLNTHFYSPIPIHFPILFI
ncbi:MAG TPA: hypothetical protein VKB49_19495 [Candidatus Sulfotelmatobacter sp.]|nr:hypothetical protein [Candidatus Sulfotelmatobacter sp.]